MNQNDEKELTVRGQIRKGLGEKWTRELEDGLFWPIAEIVEKAWENGYRRYRKATEEKTGSRFENEMRNL